MVSSNRKELLAEKRSLRRYAETCADAYVELYIRGKKICGDPIFCYDRSDETFFWQSSFDPLGPHRVRIERMESGIYGETGDNARIARAAIIKLIMMITTWGDILEKIDPPDVYR